LIGPSSVAYPMTRGTAIWVALLAASWPGAAAAARQRLVVVPFQALVRSQSARAVVMPAIEAALAAKGYEVVAGERVEQVLEADRIRYLDSLPPEQLGSMLELLGADAAVLGTVVEYVPGPDAAIALHIRVVSRDGVVWSELIALRASESAGPLGGGKARDAQELVRLACKRALESLPRGGGLAPVKRPYRPGNTPRVYRSRELLASTARICILPIENLSSDPKATRVIATALQDVLDRTPSVVVVQPAELRAALVATGVRDLTALTPDVARKLGGAIGTTLFLQGTILRYAATTPELELYLSLTDLASGRVMWSGLTRREGAEYETWTRPRGERNHAMLAERAVAEMVQAFTSK